MPPAYTSMPYSGYISQHYDKVYQNNQYNNTANPANPIVDSYERAKRAVEHARRELEEQRRAGKVSTGHDSIYEPPKNSSPPTSTRPSAAPSFCTQAVRSEAAITNYDGPATKYDGSALTSRTGYSAYQSNWSAKRGSATPRSSRGTSRSPSHPRRSPGYLNYADPEEAIRQATSPHAITARSPRSGSAKRKILAIDLDETLIHSRFEPCQADLYVPMTMDGQHYTAYVSTRPGFEQFLRKAVELFDVVIWTASLECYAGGVIDQLERVSGCGRLKRMFRESCTKQSSGYVKDLRKLLPMGDDRSLCDVAIVDNTPGVAGLQPHNLVHVKNYYDDKSDRVLLDIIPKLERMAEAGDVCQAISAY